ncbi:cell wall metabolism sensor histidine kinase WalK [Aeromicrobium sp. A1-2]|uniref:sensor histidine kinase n=1 Tax=Aeromicrobium sp. A1-2 TaxID=2107713 RepID=UPI0013C36EA6|nr:HAMP domain-containing sensor histidine kinase [Aeromicrobium sp. A1-2]
MTRRAPSAVRRLTASVRARSAIAATVVVLIGTSVGSTLLLIVLQRTLISTVEANAASRAESVSRVAATADLATIQKDLTDNTVESQVAQLIDPAGRVVASSSIRASDRLLSKLRPAPGQVVREQRDTLDVLHTKDAYLVTAQGVSRDGQTYTVIVATSIAPQSESIEILITYLLVLVPVAGLLVGAGTCIVVGRALQPVEAIRRRVSAIRAGDLADSVPVPESHDEVARLATTMNDMLRRLETAERIQRAFVSDASHELRSPIATLSASLEIADAHPNASDWSEMRTVMSLEVERMRRLVDDLLLLAKADDRGLLLSQEQVDLDDIVDQEVRRLRSAGSVQVTASIEIVRVIGDGQSLSQAVRNLVENAAQASRGRVMVSIAAEGDTAVLTVEDDGPGVPEAERGRIFERFVRLDSSRNRDEGGTGLGLAIVREIIAGHGGSVVVETSQWGGARFVVRLPRDGSADPTDA